jgi:hypothetical protein
MAVSGSVGDQGTMLAMFIAADAVPPMEFLPLKQVAKADEPPIHYVKNSLW